MYAYPTCHQKDKAIMILRFTDPDEAIALLEEAGVKLLSKKDILG